MKCPRCQTDDVYLSQSGNQNVLSLFTVSARCHRCCLLFQVPRWKNVPKKPASSQREDVPVAGEEAAQLRKRRAA